MKNQMNVQSFEKECLPVINTKILIKSLLFMDSNSNIFYLVMRRTLCVLVEQLSHNLVSFYGI